MGGGKSSITNDLHYNDILVKAKPNTSFPQIQGLIRKLQKNNPQISTCYSYQGAEVIPTKQIILNLKVNVAINQINALFGYKYYSITQNKLTKSYLLDLKDINDLFSLTESIYQSGLVEWVEPNLISGSLNNTLYPQQYYLNNTGQNGGTPNMDINAPEAWALVQSCGQNTPIRVAVIDSGVEEHDDLNNLLPIGFDARNANNPGRPLFPGESHGQACAGIIGGINNSIGIRGVATNVELLPIRIFVNESRYVAYTVAEIAQSIDWAWQIGNADILSNSWGGGAPSNAITTATQGARTSGRSGKGCIIVFSSGNNYGSNVIYPANIPEVIAVGAILNNGNLSTYSNIGPLTDVVAFGGGIPGDIVTLGRSNSYNTTFNGTSAACPQVAGVAALMLQADPNLTEVEVRQLLQSSARDLGTSGFDNNFGYGLVDAEAAVRKVLFGTPIISGPSSFCGGGQVSYTISPIPSGAIINWQTTGGI